jgi:hypothetical protein
MHDEQGKRAVAVGGMAGPVDTFHVVVPSIRGCGLSGPAYQLVVAKALRQRRADVCPHVGFSEWTHIQLPVVVTRGTR